VVKSSHLRRECVDIRSFSSRKSAKIAEILKQSNVMAAMSGSRGREIGCTHSTVAHSVGLMDLHRIGPRIGTIRPPPTMSTCHRYFPFLGWGTDTNVSLPTGISCQEARLLEQP
jgi:hypothetical protein